jgi:hypothetical protein
MIAVENQPATQKPTARKSVRTRKINRPPILPTAIYDRTDSAYVAGCSIHTLTRAYENKYLQGYRQGRLIKHSGQHLLDWLESGGKTGWSKQPKEGV